MHIPFRMGDVVIETHYVSTGYSSDPNWDKEDRTNWEKDKKGRKHIIREAQFDGDSFEYSTDRGAWFNHACFTLYKPASVSSLKELQRSLKEEEDY